MLNENQDLQAARLEVQSHGFTFESWVQDTFFNGYRQSYTQHWDVSAEANTRHGGIPVSIKATKYGGALNLGDAQRQFQISEPFLLIVGFWRQDGASKSFVNITATAVEVSVWRRLWAPITLKALQELDNVIKNTPGYSEARLEAKRIKAGTPFCNATITVNPKIDSKIQRRLQCSLNSQAFFQHLAPQSSAEVSTRPQLFGVSALEAFSSPPRVFSRPTQNSEG